MCKYMKACTLYIYQYVIEGENLHLTSVIYGVNVSLTDKGLPRILPIYFRREITRGNLPVIRVVLTILGLYRVLPCPGKVSLNTITDPFSGVIYPSLLRFIPHFFGMLNPKKFNWVFKPF